MEIQIQRALSKLRMRLEQGSRDECLKAFAALEGHLAVQNLDLDHSVITVAVEGFLTGDSECWCLEVDEKTYRRIKGDEHADDVLRWHQRDLDDWEHWEHGEHW